jgi:hypothetical protein
MEPFTSMIGIIPPGESGSVKIEHFTVSSLASEHSRARSVIQGDPWDYVPEGRYVRLMVGEHIMMSDTPSEQRSNLGIVEHAHGDVLIAGLGIGMILVPILANRHVHTVTVIELNNDVIKLVGPYVKHRKLRIINADINKWPLDRGSSWHTIYFDIWATITSNDAPEISRLKRRFAGHLVNGGWMGAWAEDMRNRQARQERADKRRNQELRKMFRQLFPA